jgi:hypothetical protein
LNSTRLWIHSSTFKNIQIHSNILKYCQIHENTFEIYHKYTISTFEIHLDTFKYIQIYYKYIKRCHKYTISTYEILSNILKYIEIYYQYIEVHYKYNQMHWKHSNTLVYSKYIYLPLKIYSYILHILKYLPNTLQYLHCIPLVYFTITLIYSNMLPYTLKLSWNLSNQHLFVLPLHYFSKLSWYLIIYYQNIVALPWHVYWNPKMKHIPW